MNIIRVEYRKLFKRIEFWCSLVIMLIPMLLFLGSKNDLSIAMAIESKSRFNTILTSLGFSLQLGIYHLIFSILATNLLSTELYNNYTTLYFPHIKDKAKLFTKKIFVINSIIFIHIIMYLFVAFIMSYLILDNKGYNFCDKDTIWYVLAVSSSVLEFTTFVNIILCLGIFVKPIQNMFIAVILFIANFLLFDIPIIGNFLPMKYIQQLLNLQENWNINLLVKNFIIILILIIVYNSIVQIIGRKKMKDYSQ